MTTLAFGPGLTAQQVAALTNFAVQSGILTASAASGGPAAAPSAGPASPPPVAAPVAAPSAPPAGPSAPPPAAPPPPPAAAPANGNPMEAVAKAVQTYAGRKGGPAAAIAKLTEWGYGTDFTKLTPDQLKYVIDYFNNPASP